MYKLLSRSRKSRGNANSPKTDVLRLLVIYTESCDATEERANYGGTSLDLAIFLADLAARRFYFMHAH